MRTSITFLNPSCTCSGQLLMPCADCPSRAANFPCCARLHRRNPGWTGDAALAVHPGLVDTQLARQWITGEDVWGARARPLLAPLMRALAPWMLLPPRSAVETLLYAAAAPAEQVTEPLLLHARAWMMVCLAL